MPILAKAVWEVETAASREQVTSAQHSRFQAVALLARVDAPRYGRTWPAPAQRDTEFRRLAGVATIWRASRRASFSGFGYETVRLVDAGSMLYGCLTALVSRTVGLGTAFLGLIIAPAV